jgi:hypothetical protein
VLTSLINTESTNQAHPKASAYLLNPNAKVLNCQFELSVKKIAKKAPKNKGAKVLNACIKKPYKVTETSEAFEVRTFEPTILNSSVESPSML